MKTIILPYKYLEDENNFEEIARRVYKKDDLIYKLCKIYNNYDYEVEYEEYIKLMNYLKKTEKFEQLVKPIDLIEMERVTYLPSYEQYRCGYTMAYLDGFINLEDYLYEQNLILKRMILMRIGSILKEISKDRMVYGDLHACNIMLDEIGEIIRFIEPNAVKVEEINIEDFDKEEVSEKIKFNALVLSNLYEADFSNNRNYSTLEKTRNLVMSKELTEYLTYLDNKENPEGFITDFNSDFDTDKLEFNKKLVNSMINN